MKVKTVYQTLEDKGNLEEIKSDGPFPCYWDNTWLGDGYYFWDTFLENAHWWGKSRKYSNGYIICKAIYDHDNNLCLDLVGNIEHMEWFANSYYFLKEKEGFADSNTTVKRIIVYLQHLNLFPYDAVRAVGIQSKSLNSEYSLTFNFEAKLRAYLDLLPPIQICFYKKNSLNLRNYEIVYPQEYSDGYVV